MSIVKLCRLGPLRPVGCDERQDQRQRRSSHLRDHWRTMTRLTQSRTLGSTVALVLAVAAASVSWSSEAVAQTRYTASWASVDQHKMPEWFEDAKFGIYYHWGAFATAAFGSEWYPRNMYNRAGNS